MSELPPPPSILTIWCFHLLHVWQKNRQLHLFITVRDNFWKLSLWIIFQFLQIVFQSNFVANCYSGLFCKFCKLLFHDNCLQKNSSTKHDLARSYFQLWLKSATRVTKSREKTGFFFGKLCIIISKVRGKLWRREGYISNHICCNCQNIIFFRNWCSEQFFWQLVVQKNFFECKLLLWILFCKVSFWSSIFAKCPFGQFFLQSGVDHLFTMFANCRSRQTYTNFATCHSIQFVCNFCKLSFRTTLGKLLFRTTFWQIVILNNVFFAN